MAYLFAAPSQVFFNLSGTSTVPLGSWNFYATNTTNRKTTYSDSAGTIPNSNPVLLDANARLATEVWLDGDYTAELVDANGVVVWNGDITSGNPAGLTIPALAAGFLTNDGSNLLWSDIKLLPDPAGSTDYMVVVNGAGTGFTLIPQPEPPVIPQPEAVVTTSSARIGTSSSTTKGLWQYGTGTTNTGVGTKTANGSVTYPTPFASAPFVVVTPKGGPHAPGSAEGGYYAKHSVTAETVNGFTATFSTATGEANADGNISAPISFTWAAYGTVVVAAA